MAVKKEKRSPGRPRIYEQSKEGHEGAPLLAVRLDPPVYSRIKSQPEGPRAYIQRLVTEDIQRTGHQAGEDGGSESGGMMGQAQIDGEMARIQAAGKKAEDELNQLVADGQVLTLRGNPEDICGHGPWGLSKEERERQEQERSAEARTAKRKKRA